jgi:leader peptidase (prepilin peptidase)/N-methyltransferase
VSLLTQAVYLSLPSARDQPVPRSAVAWPFLTLAGACLLGASFAVFGLTLVGLAAAIFCLALVVVTATDLSYRLIPNRVVLPAAGVVLVLMTAADPSPEWALAAFGAGLGLFVLALVYPAGMGMGDVKLGVLMGAALGRGVAVALVLAFVLAALPALALLVRHGRAGRTMGIPFGPFLALGSLVVLFAAA